MDIYLAMKYAGYEDIILGAFSTEEKAWGYLLIWTGQDKKEIQNNYFSTVSLFDEPMYDVLRFTLDVFD